MSFIENFSLGNVVFPNNIFYAPICGYSDISFRRVCKKYAPGLVFCEMIKTEGLLYETKTTYDLLRFEKNMHPIGAQICGNDPLKAEKVAKIIEDMGFDLIDLNCACPVKKVVKDGSGAGMLKNPGLIEEVLEAIVNSVKIPVTLKIRIGWSINSINAVDIVKIAENTGIKAICIHGRTREQGYSGLADYEVIKNCKKNAKNVKIFGSGDLFNATSVKKMFDYTKCDGVWIARGMIGNPSFIQQVKNLYLDEKNSCDVSQIKRDVLEHLDYLMQYENEKKALIMIKKFIPWYLKRCLNVKNLKIDILNAQKIKDVYLLIQNFDWERVCY